MGKYFTVDELSRSHAAKAKGIDNTPPEEVRRRMEEFIRRVLDPVRELWDAPLTVNSGYRSPELNALVGGASRSQHLAGEAADITAGNREANRRLFGIISSSGIEFDQLIDERNFSWIHISGRTTGNRREVFSL
jgi:hypothetical protein